MMPRNTPAIAGKAALLCLLAFAALAGCSSYLKSGRSGAAKEDEAMFYSDLGPDSVDVSSYPARQRENYAVYSAVCSRCHSLARSINAPMVSRGYWEFYMLGMRARSRLARAPISSQDVAAILDFLEYDSQLRKVQKREEFEKASLELKRRFDKVLSERMRRLQESGPITY